jgi:hypothetical protein
LSDLERFVQPIEGFTSKPVPFQIEVFAWYLHEVKRKDRFQLADIGACFDVAHIPRPVNLATSVRRLLEKRPPRVLKDSTGYRLHQDVRRQLEVLLPVRATSVATTQLLTSLLSRVTNPVQKTFLTETLICYKHQAYRATVVMAWNLAFNDVLDRIVAHHLGDFNKGVGTNNLKKPISRREDFENFGVKESDIIKIARATGVIGKETTKTLEEKLNKRNTAAHPSNVVVSPATAEEVIFDLVENVILKQTL